MLAPLSEIRYPRSEVRSPGSEVRFPRSEIRFPWSEGRFPGCGCCDHQTSRSVHILHVKLDLPHRHPRISDLGYLISEIGPPTSDFGSRSSDFRSRITGLGSLISNLGFPLPRSALRALKLDHWLLTWPRAGLDGAQALPPILMQPGLLLPRWPTECSKIRLSRTCP